MEHSAAIKTQDNGAAFALLALGVIAVVGALVWCYFQGLSGPFVFDDIPNLTPLAVFDGNVTWQGLKAYLATGVAGPSGRPLSLLSFVLNGNDWPVSPFSFKLTNVLVHALNSILVFWFSLLLINRVRTPSVTSTAVAALIAMFWAFSPYHTSTVLYVVQRMAMLSATFVLAGLILYFKGRVLVEERGTRQKGLFWIFAAYFVGAGLGVLSKENAALFVLMVPLVEWIFCASGHLPQATKRLLWIVIGLPAVLFIVALGLQIPSFRAEYLWYRDFSLGERLLTQARALGYYLWRYLVPGTDYMGLFGDGFRKSTGILEPLSTLLWWLAHAVLIGVAVRCRKALPLLSFSVLFFYVAHIMESTIVPLALIFEHRNYLPSAFLLLPLASIPSTRNVAVGLVVLVAVSGGLLRAEAFNWGEGTRFLTTQLERNPDSEWVVDELSAWYFNQGHQREAIDLLREFSETHEASLRLRAKTLRMACDLGDVTREDVDRLVESSHVHPGRPEMLTREVDQLALIARKGVCPAITLSTLREFLINHASVLEQSPQGKHALLASYATLARHEGNYAAYREAVVGAVQAHPNALYTLNSCQILAKVSSQDACACLKAGAAAFEGGDGIQKSLVRSMLGIPEQVREKYVAMKRQSCRFSASE